MTHSATRRGYADTQVGQIHYRVAGEGQRLLLLHWTPGSGAQYEALLTELAQRGYCACAPDLAGFGSSAGDTARWRIEDYATNMLQFATALGWERFALLGGHISSEIAAQMAVSEPQRITHLLLDGSPTWDRTFRTDVIENHVPAGPPVSMEDGSHLLAWWSHILDHLRIWNPNFKFDEAGAAQAMNVLLYELQSRMNVAGYALVEFELSDCLAKIRVPTLALTASSDPLYSEHSKALALLRHAIDHEFPGDHPIHDPRRVVEYADAVHRFLTRQ